MSNEWDALADEVETVLVDGVRSFAEETKAELGPFLKEKAGLIAKYRWQELKAGTEEEKERAKSNLAHLHAQVGGEIAIKQLVATKRAEELLLKVFDVVVSGVKRLVLPGLLGG